MLSHGWKCGKPFLKGAWSGHVSQFDFGGHQHISGTADRLRRCQRSSPVSVVNFVSNALNERVICSNKNAAAPSSERHWHTFKTKTVQSEEGAYDTDREKAIRYGTYRGITQFKLQPTFCPQVSHIGALQMSIALNIIGATQMICLLFTTLLADDSVYWPMPNYILLGDRDTRLLNTLFRVVTQYAAAPRPEVESRVTWFVAVVGRLAAVAAA